MPSAGAETTAPSSDGGPSVTPDDGCPDEHFIDHDGFVGPGSEYPDPILEVTCADGNMTVVSNGLPHYTYVPMTPNGLAAQDFVWTIPLSPEVADETSAIPLLGTVGFGVSGAPIYGANEGPFPDPYGDPVANGIMDWCGGHTGGNADYHYHTLYESMLTDQDGDGEPTCMDADESTDDGAGLSPVLGYALDGFPLYGPRGCLDADCVELVEFQSGWENTGYLADSLGCETTSDCGNPSGCNDPQTAANFECYACNLAVIAGEVARACLPTTYSWDNHVYVAKDGDQWLDECNGRVGADGTYGYHVTSTFPYTLGCYRGTAQGAGENEAGGPGGGPPGGGPPGG